MGGETTKTTAQKTTSRIAPTKVTKGGKDNKKYIRDEKCSVDIKRPGRSEEGAQPVSKGPARDEKFDKGGTGRSKSSAKSASDTPKDAKSRACSLWMEEALVLGLRKIRKEFVEHVKGYIPSGSIKACTEYNAYNRYEDVNCLDKTRVVIKSTYMTTGEDYIHASYVNVNPDLVYICAQGPLDTTCGHFWLMIMQEKSKVILQLCSFMEDGKEKCNEYYPAKGTEWETYGCVQVRVTDRNSNIPGMKKVVKSKMQVRIEDTTDVHEVTHIFFHGWPDHGVPESIGTVREIRNLIHRTYEKKPIVAHCSAGIGRTGTFVMMELVLYHLLDKHDAKFKMYEVAKELRNQRMHALQNDLQYVLVYRCVIDVLINENAILQSAEITKFNDEFADLIKRKRGADKKPKNRATT